MAIDAGMAIRKLLIDDAAVAALVGTRIRPQKASQKDRATRPYMVYRTIIGRRTHHLGGSSLLNIGIVQVEGYSDTSQQLVDLIDAVRKELDGRQRTTVTLSGNPIVITIHLDNQRDLASENVDGSDQGLYGFQMDFLVMHQEAA